MEQPPLRLTLRHLSQARNFMDSPDRLASWIGALSVPFLASWGWIKRKSMRAQLNRVEKKLDDLIFHLATTG